MAFDAISNILDDFVSPGVEKQPQKVAFREWGQYVERGGYLTRAAFAAASINALIDNVVLLGYFAAYDMPPARYKRLGATPSPVYNHHIQSADGAWWVLSCPEQKADIRAFGFTLGNAAGAFAGANDQAIVALRAFTAVKEVFIPAGVHEFSGLIAIDRHELKIRGVRAFSQFPAGNVAGTCLKFYGAAGSTAALMEHATTGDIYGAAFDDIQIDGNGLLATGIVTRATQNCSVSGTAVWNLQATGTPVAYYFGSKTGTATELNCNFGSRFDDNKAVVVNAGIAFIWSGKASVSGQATTFASAARNHATHDDGTAFLVQDGDDNFFLQCACSRLPGGTGAGLEIDGNTLAGKYPVCNKFEQFHAGVSDGTAVIKTNGPRAKSNFVAYTAVDSVPDVQITGGAELLTLNFGNPYTRTIAKDFPVMAGFGIKPPQVSNPDKQVLSHWDGNMAGVTLGLLFNNQAVGWTFTSTVKAKRKGDEITIDYSIQVTAVGTAGTGVKISGLPEAAASGLGTFSPGACSGLAGLTGQLHGNPVSGATQFNLYQMGATGSGALSNANFPVNAIIAGTLTYNA